jgi:hypothetical protein
MIRNASPHDGRRFLAGFGLLSLLTVAAGCAVASAHGVPAGSWARNLVGWAAGAALAWGIARKPAVLAWMLAATPVALAATRLDAGLEGVHRWIQLGPLRLNAAAIFVPAAIVALAVLRERRWSWAAAAVSLGLLVVQPDASQAAALGMGMIVVLASLRANAAIRAGGAIAILLAIAAAAMRPDPLAPVPEVEGIVGLAWAWSPLAAVVAVGLLAATVLAPRWLASRAEGTEKTAAIALFAVLALTALAPAFAAFPVPLAGMGMSPVLGFWLGAGALAAAARSDAERTRRHGSSLSG